VPQPADQAAGRLVLVLVVVVGVAVPVVAVPVVAVPVVAHGAAAPTSRRWWVQSCTK
jgi:hypothetical protein